MAKQGLVAVLSAPIALAACHSSTGLPTDPPKQVSQVATGGFQSPTDAVASPDGGEFYFAAWDMNGVASIFSTSSKPGSTPSAIASDEPLEVPIGLVMSCDGSTLYIADMGGESGAILSLSTMGGTPTDLGATSIVRPGGLAMSHDCKTLYATGMTADLQPALFTMPVAGGAASIVWMGPPLVSPTGVHVDEKGVAWVMDHLAPGQNGDGVLFAIPSDGSAANEVVSDLRIGTPGGVSLVAGGGTAVIPTKDHDGNSQLTSVVIATGAISHLATPDLLDPAGLRTARQAGVFALVDSEGGAIYRAE